jgi:hypothetical protein
MVVLLMIQVNLPAQRAKPAHISSHLPTSPHLTFLDSLVKAGQFSYHFFQWVLDGSIDVASLVEKCDLPRYLSSGDTK